MSNNVTVELNSSGIQELLRSSEVSAYLLSMAQQMQARAGDGYEASVKTGSKRARATVSTASYAAMKDNLENNTLLRVIT